MRLIDRKQRQPRALEQVQAARREEPLGRHIEQVEVACEQALLDRVGLVP